MSANTATAEKATNDETTAKGGVSTKRPTLKKAPGGKTAAKAGTAGAVEAKPGPKAKPATTKPTTTIGLGTDPCSLTNRPRPAWAQAWRAIEGAVADNGGKPVGRAEALDALAKSVREVDNVINVSLHPDKWASNTLRDGITRGYFTAN